MPDPTVIRKVLSANDIGLNGAHQAGILIPKDPAVLTFFPRLDPGLYNPRQLLRFEDEAGAFWEFAFIYYNNRLHSRGGTRDEYRLTRMTRFLAECRPEPGNVLRFSRDGDDFRIDAERVGGAAPPDGDRPRIRLTGGWIVVGI